jgi:hypothetical protein
VVATLLFVGSLVATFAVNVAGGATTTTTTAIHVTNSPVKWIDEDVSFRVGGVTVYASFRHPVRDTGSVPAVLLIAGSGPTDRNGNSAVEPGPINTLKTLADWLSDDGVASLRYDKLGSGKTGLGAYASKVNSIGIFAFEQESRAALTFLAAQKGVNDQRLAVFGHSEGALFALLLATGHAGSAPTIHALGLFEPLSLRYLTLITVQVDAQVATQLKSGAITKKLATMVDDTLNKAVTSLRSTGTVQANLPYGLGTILNPSTEKFLYQADQFDPQTLAEALPTKMPVLVTCSSADSQVSCAQVGRIAKGLARADARTHFVHLVGVDHVLKVDSSGTSVNYTKKLPFSPALRTALKTFVKNSL